MRKVLIVEDAQDILLLLKVLCESEGYLVETATHGQEALKILTSAGVYLPDVILLDLRMPVMNGLEFLKEFRKNQNWKGLPVVVMSAQNISRDSTPKELLECCFLRKPFDVDQVLTVLKTAIEGGESCTSIEGYPCQSPH